MVGCIARSPGRRILLLALSMEPQGWTDLVAAFVGDWVDSLLRLAEGIPKPERLPFFDGPFGHLNYAKGIREPRLFPRRKNSNFQDGRYLAIPRTWALGSP